MLVPQWFWEPDLHVRTLDMLIPIYHDIVGRGMMMEIAFSIDRDGLVQDTHAAQYKGLGRLGASVLWHSARLYFGWLRTRVQAPAARRGRIR